MLHVTEAIPCWNRIVLDMDDEIGLGEAILPGHKCVQSAPQPPVVYRHARFGESNGLSEGKDLLAAWVNVWKKQIIFHPVALA